MLEDGKRLLEKLTGGRKLRKDQWLIVILMGVLLCVISLPVEKSETKSDISDNTGAKISELKQPSTDVQSADYVREWEEKLEKSLLYIEGAGQVKVLITLQESEQRVLARDGTESISETTEEDAAGGSRRVTENRIEKKTIYTVDERGQDVPYVIKTITPSVKGVVVIAQGADQPEVRQNIIEAIQVLFDIDMNKITIVKMKNKNQ
ncbi:MAG: stage III sporulation protein AG [Lachnospiraceae bacterium]|nr:stage III sporulation protein AG [Lachnospiraceae bacterium]